MGELIGRDPIGVVATSNIDEIIALAPDAVAYYSIIRQGTCPGTSSRSATCCSLESMW